MKKKNLTSLSLKKTSVSKLNGGTLIPTPLSRRIQECLITQDLFNCTWVSELFTACNCEPSWDFGCQESLGIPCEEI